MKAVIYARYSTESQREESIEGQIRECTEYAARNGITLLRTYIDRALSARTADRPEFQRMIADSEGGLFDAVLVWKLDRFSRDRYDSAHYKHILKKNGVRVISAKENISDGPEGIILESMLEGYAEYYSAELSQKIQRGQYDNAMKCKNNGGNIPYGYYVDKNTGVLAVDPVKAPVVREIYTWFDAGERITDIRKSLNDRGLRTGRGVPFTIGGVSLILKNRKYIGEYRYSKVVIPDGIPAIIDKELFERVQRRMKANQKAPARAKAAEEYLLTTKLFCGTCGRIMAGESGKGSKGTIYHYYKCSGSKRHLGCKRKALKKDWIERTVVQLTVTKVLTDTAIDRIADAMVTMQAKEDTTIPALQQQLRACEKGIENILNAIQMGILTVSTKERLEQLEQQRETLKASILQAQIARPQYSKEQIVQWISRFKYGNINDKAYQREIIDVFVNSVYVYDDKLVLTYNFKDGTQTMTLKEIEDALSSDMTCFAPPKKNHHLSVVIFFGGARTRTHLNAICLWHIAATSSKTGGIYTICPQRDKSAIESYIVHQNTAALSVSRASSITEPAPIKTLHASGILRPPADKTGGIYTICPPEGQIGHRVLYRPPKYSSSFGEPSFFYHRTRPHQNTPRQRHIAATS